MRCLSEVRHLTGLVGVPSHRRRIQVAGDLDSGGMARNPLTIRAAGRSGPHSGNAVSDYQDSFLCIGWLSVIEKPHENDRRRTHIDRPTSGCGWAGRARISTCISARELSELLPAVTSTSFLSNVELADHNRRS